MNTGKYIISVGFNDIEVPELIYHVFQGNLAAGRQQLKMGADVLQKDSNGHDALFWAAYKNDVKMLGLLEEFGALPKITQSDYDNLIANTSSVDDVALLEFWLSVGRGRFTAPLARLLFAAVNSFSLGKMKCLLEAGADPNILFGMDDIDSPAMTSLHLAAKRNFLGGGKTSSQVRSRSQTTNVK